MNAPLLDRYADQMAGTLTCYDRIVITGTLPAACHAAGMTSYLNVSTATYPNGETHQKDQIR